MHTVTGPQGEVRRELGEIGKAELVAQPAQTVARLETVPHTVNQRTINSRGVLSAARINRFASSPPSGLFALPMQTIFGGAT